MPPHWPPVRYLREIVTARWQSQLIGDSDFLISLEYSRKYRNSYRICFYMFLSKHLKTMSTSCALERCIASVSLRPRPTMEQNYRGSSRSRIVARGVQVEQQLRLLAWDKQRSSPSPIGPPWIPWLLWSENSCVPGKVIRIWAPGQSMGWQPAHILGILPGNFWSKLLEAVSQK